jgi:signal transduction histidine kinase/DNA-binding response OmpR family regulator
MHQRRWMLLLVCTVAALLVLSLGIPERYATLEIFVVLFALGLLGVVYSLQARQRGQLLASLDESRQYIKSILDRVNEPVAIIGADAEIEIRSTPLHGQSGEVAGAIEIRHTLNEQERLALRLERTRKDMEAAKRARTEFVTTMSHEVRTPMTTVLGMIDLLKLTDLKRRQQIYIEIIESSGNMLLSLVDNMLDFGTLEAKGMALTRNEFTAGELLESVLTIMGYQACAKNLELVGRASGDTRSYVVGDRQRLRQIMANLVGNAIKYTRNGDVAVSVEVEPGSEPHPQLIVTVSDTGAGMTAEAVERLSRPFSSLDSGKRRNVNHGAGLGMWISKRLAEIMGGDIHVESEVGQGTRATLRVPIELVPGPPEIPEDWHRAFGGRRVLVVEDNATAAGAISDTLQRWSMVWELVDGVREARRRLRSASNAGKPFDAILIDIATDDGSRQEFARSIRSDESLADLPILLMMSIACQLNVGEISAIGKARCINKPVLPSELGKDLYQLFATESADTESMAVNAAPALSILIAEDNPVNRRVLQRMLESLGHDVSIAEDGIAALAALSSRRFDLALMDCQMPGLDGEEVTQKIRAEGTAVAQPVIVAVTADVSPRHRESCLQSGMDAFLEKPVRLRTLESSLREWSQMRSAAARKSDRPGPVSEETRAGKIAKRLLERSGNDDPAFVNEYIDMFVEDATVRLAVMRAALEREDSVTLGRECHALRGACLELGIERLGNYCDALRKANAGGRIEELPAALARVGAEFDRIKPEFEAEKARTI